MNNTQKREIIFNVFKDIYPNFNELNPYCNITIDKVKLRLFKLGLYKHEYAHHVKDSSIFNLILRAKTEHMPKLKHKRKIKVYIENV